MWLEEADSFAEFFRGFLPYYLLVALPLFIIISPINPVAASHEFPVYRMQQYDLHGVPHGCRSASVNLEARSLSGWGTSRHCVVCRLRDLTVERFLQIRAKAGALLLLLPKSFADLSDSEREHLLLLENAMLAQEISVPVYFAPWSIEMNGIVEDLADSFKADDKSGSAADAMFNMASANGYQIVISGGVNQKQELKVATVHGQLTGRDNARVPTIVIVAHYDSAAVAPELAIGAESNAGGVSALVELARVFSQLYASSGTRGSANLVFLVTGAARMNYYSTKKWIEDQLDSVDSSLIQDASFVMCLESVASGDSLVMHVSKPPKEGSPTDLFFRRLKQAAATRGAPLPEGMHKKINLADDNLAWEHERFSIRRLPAFTLSSLKSYKSWSRWSMLDTLESVNVGTLTLNTQIVAEALAAYLYNLSSTDYSAVFTDSLKVEEAALDSWMKFLTRQARATQLVSSGASPAVTAIADALSRYLPDLAITHYTPDKRDPEFSTYTPTSAMLNVYNVKPAVFDLLLTAAISLYLAAVYFFIVKFPTVYAQVCKYSSDTSVKMFKMQ